MVDDLNVRGNSRIANAFTELMRRNEKALICYVTAGDPDLDTTRALVQTLVEAGSDLVEIGVPFSDPLADGPVIQRASQRALARGTTLRGVLNLVDSLRKEMRVPLILLSYANPVFRFGLDEFAEVASTVGVDGLIVPDLPLEESDVLRSKLKKRSVDLIPMLAPTSTDTRLHSTAQVASGFIYCVALTGVTGTRKNVAPDIEQLVRRIRGVTNIPLAVGFGVSNAMQAQVYARSADGVIVGSAVVERMERYGSEGLPMVAELVAEVKAALQRADGAPE